MSAKHTPAERLLASASFSHGVKSYSAMPADIKQVCLSYEALAYEAGKALKFLDEINSNFASGWHDSDKTEMRERLLGLRAAISKAEGRT